MPIETIRHKGVRELFEVGTSRRIGKRQHKRIIQLLDILDAADAEIDLQGVARFHALTGNRKGEFAMDVTGNWRLTFKFEDGWAWDIDYEDYH